MTTLRTTIRTTIRTALALLAAIVAVLSTLAAAPASAAPPSYIHMPASFTFQGGIAGGYVDCPTGMLAVASGAVASDLHAIVLSGVTTPAHTGSFASAIGRDGEFLQVKSQCVDAGKLRGTTTASFRLRDHRDGFRYYTEQATCPTGTVAYGGGGTVYDGSVYDVRGLYTYGTKPDGRSWTYAGGGELKGRTLAVEAHCLPRARLGKIVTVTQDVTSTPKLGQVFVGARCPAGFSAFAGGAWYHLADSEAPMRLGALRVSEMSADDRGWFAAGDVYSSGIELTAKVRCTDRLG